jgi:hypothetical protein
MLRDFRTPRLTVPYNVVKQIAEGPPVILALLCGGLRGQYAPETEGLPPNILGRLRGHGRVPHSVRDARAAEEVL